MHGSWWIICARVCSAASSPLSCPGLSRASRSGGTAFLSEMAGTSPAMTIERQSHLPRYHHPIIQIQDHCRVVIVALLQREIAARPVFRGDGAQAQGADI